MESRTTSSQVTFSHSFQLKGVAGLQSPGRYTLIVEEQKLDTLSVDAWRQTSAALHIPVGGAIEHAAVDLNDLRAALTRDALPLGVASSGATSTKERRGILHLSTKNV
jgi:hypothetical protein